MKKINTRSKNKKTKVAIVSAAAVLVLAGAYAAYASVYNAWPFQKSAEESSQTNKDLYGSSQTTPDDKTPASDPDDGSGNISSSKGPGDGSAPTIDDSVSPRKPTGGFVSNHRPNLDGSPAPNSMSSTCSTTPGASCYISFSRAGTVKKLPAKKTNSDGNVIWEWKLQDIGLTAGEWKITAVAVNGDKTATTSDSIPLNIGN